MPKPSEQVVDEYREADTPYDWLVGEVASYFFDDVADPDERVDHATALILDSEDAYVELAEAAVEPGELIACAVRIVSPDGDTVELDVFRKVPPPVMLLSLCADRARRCDVVHVEQVFGDGRTATFAATWPFQMADAVMMTNPAVRDMTAATLAESDWAAAVPAPRRIGRAAALAAAAAAAAAATGAALLIGRRKR